MPLLRSLNPYAGAMASYKHGAPTGATPLPAAWRFRIQTSTHRQRGRRWAKIRPSREHLRVREIRNNTWRFAPKKHRFTPETGGYVRRSAVTLANATRRDIRTNTVLLMSLPRPLWLRLRRAAPSRLRARINPGSWSRGSHGFFAALLGADADGVLNGDDENLAIANLAGFCGFDNRLDGGRHQFVG